MSLRISGLIKGKSGPQDSSISQQALFGGTWVGLQEGSEVPPIERPSRERGVGSPPRRLIGQGISWGVGN